MSFQLAMAQAVSGQYQHLQQLQVPVLGRPHTRLSFSANVISPPGPISMGNAPTNGYGILSAEGTFSPQAVDSTLFYYSPGLPPPDSSYVQGTGNILAEVHPGLMQAAIHLIEYDSQGCFYYQPPQPEPLHENSLALHLRFRVNNPTGGIIKLILCGELAGPNRTAEFTLDLEDSTKQLNDLSASPSGDLWVSGSPYVNWVTMPMHGTSGWRSPALGLSEAVKSTFVFNNEAVKWMLVKAKEKAPSVQVDPSQWSLKWVGLGITSGAAVNASLRVEHLSLLRLNSKYNPQI